MEKSLMLLIGGEKKFGSGKIVLNLKILMQKIDPKFIFFSTNNVLIRVLLLFRLIRRSQNVIFQPSIYGYSIFRDFVIFCIFLVTRRKYSILLLCDLKAARFHKLAKVLLTHKFCKEVYTCSSPKDISLRKKKSFRQLDQNYKEYVNKSFTRNLSIPLKEIEMIYGNYLKKEKGLENFYFFLNKMKIEKYKIFGNRESNDCYNPQYSEKVTLSEKEFMNYFELVKNNINFQCYFYGSILDLSPLVIETAIAQGFPIITLKGSYASEILTSFLTTDCFTEIADEQTKVNTIELKESWENARNLITRRPTLDQLIKRELLNV